MSQKQRDKVNYTDIISSLQHLEDTYFPTSLHWGRLYIPKMATSIYLPSNLPPIISGACVPPQIEFIWGLVISPTSSVWQRWYSVTSLSN